MKLFRRHPDKLMRSERGRDLVALVIYVVIALAAFVVGSVFGNVHGDTIRVKATAWSSAAAFLVFGVMATRAFARMLGHIVAVRTMASAGYAVRLIGSITGYVIVLFMLLSVLNVSVERLVLGGALTGVVLGIAAQQSLGNVFAGIVLLLARPFSIGDHIRLRSGQLGGELDGVVHSVSLTYVTIISKGGPLKIPNSAMLAAGVGPFVAPPGEQSGE